MPELDIPDSFAKTARKKPAVLVAAIAKCVDQLGKDPHYPGLHTHKVKGKAGVWEAYVDGANRVTFEYFEGRIRLRNNCNHDILKRP